MALEHVQVMWAKAKWYVITAAFVCGLIILYTVFAGDDDAKDQLNKWMFDKRLQLVKDQIKKTTAKSDEAQVEINKIDKKIQDIESKKESDNEKIDKASIVELKDLFKELHS